jgi:AcrR family transcriptional regulator
MLSNMSSNSIRARVRQELTTEIKAVARRQLATEGANLSLRAVARELGMVSSAVYRYFPSRDDLLTALIIDCYNEMGEVAESAAATGGTTLARWLAVGHAIRDWALANPAEYALIYGSPVPGYRAPQDTIGPASRPTVVLASFLAEGQASGELGPSYDRDVAPPPALEAELVQALPVIAPGIPIALLLRGLTAWIQLYGVITFELFGRLNNFIESSRREFFDHQMRVMAREIGL